MAGDYIKECSDLCLPLVAVGCMYPEGYLRQQIRSNGWQENFVESINREAAPMYYKMSESSIPHQWVRLMKKSIKSNAAGFSARRMVRQYIEKFYSKSMEAALKD